jgi:hypothetical protein
VNLTAAEDRAFWTWAAMEVLRHAGVRMQEMLAAYGRDGAALGSR